MSTEIKPNNRIQEKLFNHPLSGVYAPFKDLVHKQLILAFTHKSDDFLLSPYEYLTTPYGDNQDEEGNPKPSLQQQDTLKLLEKRGLDFLENNMFLNQWGKVNQIYQVLTDEYCIINALLEDMVCVCVDLESPIYKATLHTRNIDLLEAMQKNNLLEIDLQTAIGHLLTNKTNTATSQGLHTTVRLDLKNNQRIQGNPPTFTGIVPQSNMEIGVGCRYAIIPVPFYHLFSDFIQAHYYDTPFRITQSTPSSNPTKSFIASISPQVVKQVYKEQPNQEVLNHINRFQPYYDPCTQRFYVYDVEAPINEIGVQTFRPEMLISIEQITKMSQIDKSKHNLDYQLIPNIFRTKVKQATNETFQHLNFMDLSSFATVKDKQEALIRFASTEKPKTLYSLMKTNSKFFGNIDTIINSRYKHTPKYLKNYQLLDLPPITSTQDIYTRRDYIRKLLATGVLHITSLRKDGSPYQVIATNNHKVLSSPQALNKNYIEKYENPRRKVNYVKHLIQQGQITTLDDLKEWTVRLDLYQYVDQQELLAPLTPQYNNEAFQRSINALNNGSYNLQEEYVLTRKHNPSNIIYRNPYATSKTNFFGTISVDAITTLEYAPYEVTQ